MNLKLYERARVKKKGRRVQRLINKTLSDFRFTSGTRSGGAGHARSPTNIVKLRAL
jgi:hypothetical protein